MCQYAAAFNYGLQKHVKAVHEKIKPYKCDLCQFKSGWNRSFQRHVKSCSSQKLMYSEKKFTKQIIVKEHSECRI